MIYCSDMFGGFNVDQYTVVVEVSQFKNRFLFWFMKSQNKIAVFSKTTRSSQAATPLQNHDLHTYLNIMWKIEVDSSD